MIITYFVENEKCYLILPESMLDLLQLLDQKPLWSCPNTCIKNHVRDVFIAVERV